MQGTDPVIVKCIIRDNRALRGAGVFVSGSTARLSQCQFINNEVEQDGGAVYATDSNSLLITGCLFADNRSKFSGAALYNYSESKVTLVNSVFYDNTAYQGGAVYNHKGIDSNIVNCTFSDNFAIRGPAIYAGQDCNIAVTNSILWLYNSVIKPVYDPCDSVRLSFCCVKGGYSGQGNIDSEPNFADSYHLDTNSPCVNKGGISVDADMKINLPDTDFDGQPRILGCRIDIGADEAEVESCITAADTEYDDWIALGKPCCWCQPYQCYGDIDGSAETVYKYRIFSGDLDLLTANWMKKIGDASLNPCADVDHRDSGPPHQYRVYYNDLAVLISNWKKTEAELKD